MGEKIEHEPTNRSAICLRPSSRQFPTSGGLALRSWISLSFYSLLLSFLSVENVENPTFTLSRQTYSGFLSPRMVYNPSLQTLYFSSRIRVLKSRVRAFGYLKREPSDANPIITVELKFNQATHRRTRKN